MRTKLFVPITTLALLTCLAKAVPVAASEDASSSAGGSEIIIRKKTAESTQTANQILQNLEKLSKNQHQTEEIKDKYEDISTKNRGFVAQITSLKDDSFKIRTPDDEEFFITPDKSTTIIKKGKVTTGDSYTMANWFAIDDWLVLIGTQNGEVFSPRRIIVSSESLAPQKNFVIKGVIKNVTSSKVEIMPINGNSVETFKIDKQTNLLDHHQETITSKDLQLEQKVLLVGTQESDNSQKQLLTLRVLE